MRVVSRRKILLYIQNNVNSAKSLTHWYYSIMRLNASNHHELKTVFPSADVVGKYTIFNIGGNSYRLIASIHYNTKMLFVREIWTHAQYSKKINQIKLEAGDL